MQTRARVGEADAVGVVEHDDGLGNRLRRRGEALETLGEAPLDGDARAHPAVESGECHPPAAAALGDRRIERAFGPAD